MSRQAQTAAISLTALATALAAQPAAAQTAPQSPSYIASNPTVTSGSVTYDRGVTTPGTEVYTIDSPTAVLDFTPSDMISGGGPINFQQSNTTVVYRNGSAVSDFTVLNRIIPADSSRAIQFNGHIISEIVSSTGPARPGGSVWFYSPGGIILGAGSSFDVGNLLLTARDPIGGGTTIPSTAGFVGGGAAGHGITVQAGAKITASPKGSYVALMAPSVDVEGDITVNGNVALVGAESATLTINNGLFDIAVGTGSDSSTPVSVLGKIGGAASTGAADPHGIYLVAVPKNTAITLLVAPTGDFGFDVATTAGVVNGQIVLSAGYDVQGGQLGLLSAAPTSAPASIDINSGHFTSDVASRSTQWGLVGATGLSPTFDGDLTIQAGLYAQVLADRAQGQSITIGGDLTLIADGTAASNQFGGTTVTGGNAAIITSGNNTVHVGGDAELRADATLYAGNAAASDATAGSAWISADSGSIIIDGALTTSASTNAYALSSDSLGATIRGGNVWLSTANAGTLTVGGPVRLYADAFAGSASATSPGAAYGGTISVLTNGGGGELTLNGSLSMSAAASGNSTLTDGVSGGAAYGGDLSIASSGGPITVAGTLTETVNAHGGDGFGNGSNVVGSGTGLAGTVSLSSGLTGAIDIAGEISLGAAGSGGVNNSGNGEAFGGEGGGGSITVTAGGTIRFRSAFAADASGFGGSRYGGNGGAGGVGRGGSVRIYASTGTLQLDDNLDITSNGHGGNALYSTAADGGAGYGGGVRIDTTAPSGILTIAGNATMTSDGFGGTGGNAVGTVGGGGYGGTPDVDGQTTYYNNGVYFLAEQGTLTLSGSLAMESEGNGGSGASGGEGVGGYGSLGFTGETTVLGTSLGSFTGYGGSALSVNGAPGGDGGTGTGGYIGVGTNGDASGAGFVHVGSAIFAADGEGGDGADGIGGAGGRGGDGIGGTAAALAEASSAGVTAGEVTLTAVGLGGEGGAGSAGTAGGAGFAGGAGGAGTGGITSVGVVSGEDFQPNAATSRFGLVTLYAVGAGGQGGNGGNGGAGIDATDPGADGGDGGAGGSGGVGGAANGGSTIVYARGNQVTAGDVNINASGLGGTGGGAGSGGAGGAGAPGANNSPNGSPGNSGADGTGGSGGGARGGSAGLLATNRYQRTDRGDMRLGNVSILTAGIGGGGSISGVGIAGDGAISVIGGDLQVDSLSWFNSIGQPSTQQPDISIEVTDGTLNGGDFFGVQSARDMTLDVHDGGVFKGLNMSLSGSGALLPADPTATAGEPGTIDLEGDLDIGFGGDVTLLPNVQAGRVTISTGGALTAHDIVSGSGLSLTATSIATGDLHALSINGTATDNGLHTGSITAAQGSVRLAADIGTIETGAITASDSIDVEANGNVTTGDLVAGSNGYDNVDADIYVSSDFGSILVGNASGLEVTLDQGDDREPVPGTITAGNLTAEKMTVVGYGDVRVGNVFASNLSDAFNPPDGLQIVLGSGLGNLKAGDVTGQSTIILGGLGGTVSTGNLRTPGTVAVFGEGDITLGNVTTGTGSGDSLYVSSSSVLNTDPAFARYDDSFEDDDTPIDPSILLTASRGTTSGTLTVGTVSTGNFLAAAGSSQLGDVTATRQFSLLDAQLAAFTGQILSPDINIASNDINLANGAALGSAQTGTLRLTSLGNQITLGGDGGGNGYVLDAAEAGRIHGQAITIAANGQQNGDIVVRGVTFNGAGGTAQPTLFGNNASLTLNARGSVQVLGNLAVANTMSTDRLLIVAGTRVVVVTDQGGAISMTGPGQNNSSGALAGTLGITAPVIASANAAVIQKLIADPRYTGRNADLAAVPGTPRPEGFLQAGRINLAASNVIAIQNSGTASIAAGFTAGTGGMGIQAMPTPTGQRVQVNIWGRALGADGQFRTNYATIGSIQFSAADTQAADVFATYDPTSAVNGCAINTTCTVDRPPDEQQPGTIVTTVEALEEVLSTTSRDVLALPAISFVRLVDQAGLVSDPIITEPVSGTGNAGLWDAPAETGRKEDEQ